MAGTKSGVGAKAARTGPKAARKAKPASGASARSAASPAAAAPEAGPEASAAPEAARAAGAVLTTRDLVDRVVAASGAKKKDAKPIIESALKIIGEALSDGGDLNLNPLGRVRVAREKDVAGGTMMVLKLRRPGTGKDAPARGSGKADEGLAEDEE